MTARKRLIRYVFPVLWIAFAFTSCKKDKFESELVEAKIDTTGYDIILVVGQSNTHSGPGLNSDIDKSDSLIFQLGRFNGNDKKIIPAVEPLEHYTRNLQKIGFALPFAKLYKTEVLKGGRKVLIIPCGMGDTGFRKGRWNKGDDLYEDAVNRSNLILKNYPGSRMVAILWHQGEADINTSNYQSALDNMIANMRNDIKSAAGQKLPFIVGGMVPYWVDQDNSRMALEAIIKDTPRRVQFTAFADPRAPFVIEKADNAVDAPHYDAAGQREFAKRYYSAFAKLYAASNSNKIGAVSR